MKNIVDLIGRVLLGLIFLFSAVGKILDFQGTVASMQAKGMTFMTEFFLGGAIIFLLAGSTLLIIGYRAKLGAALLMLFIIPATLIFHNELGEQMQMIQFMKNLSITGGLLVVMANGSGKYSVKKLLASTKA